MGSYDLWNDKPEVFKPEFARGMALSAIDDPKNEGRGLKWSKECEDTS